MSFPSISAVIAAARGTPTAAVPPTGSGAATRAKRISTVAQNVLSAMKILGPVAKILTVVSGQPGSKELSLRTALAINLQIARFKLNRLVPDQSRQFTKAINDVRQAQALYLRACSK